MIFKLGENKLKINSLQWRQTKMLFQLRQCHNLISILVY